MADKLKLSPASLAELEGAACAKAYANVPMSQHTTIRLGGPADYMVTPSGTAELAATVRWAHANSVPSLVIGAGSNLLVADKGIRGLVIRTAGLKAWHVKGNVLAAEAGVFLPALSAALADAGMAGFTEACGIPGSLGGALHMNAGAYGWNIAHVTRRVLVAGVDGEAFELDRDGMCFGLKSSVLMSDGYIALSMEAELRAADSGELKMKARALLEERAAKQPLEIPNAGCAFKNPRGSGAGRLIDACGLKGRALGGAQVSTKHANFIVNASGANSSDVKALMDEVRQKVYEKFGERLEPEIRLVGEWDA